MNELHIHYSGHDPTLVCAVILPLVTLVCAVILLLGRIGKSLRVSLCGGGPGRAARARCVTAPGLFPLDLALRGALVCALSELTQVSKLWLLFISAAIRCP